MKRYLFLYQDKLETLLISKQIELEKNLLRINSNGLCYRIIPAVKVLFCETSLKDPFQLTGKFIPVELLTRCGADLFLSSFIFRNESYQIESGYLASPIDEPKLAGDALPALSAY